MAKVKYALACDDVRQEKSGKFIVIGLYTNDAVVAGFPYQQNLSYIIALSELDKDYEIKVEISLASGGIVGSGGVSIKAESDASKLAILALPPVLIHLSAPDTVVATMVWDDERREELARLSFRVATALEQQMLAR